MSRDDLLADLQGEASARPAAPTAAPAPTRTGRVSSTPALDVSVTPLEWSLPRLAPARHGIGLSVRLGPVQVSLGVR